MEYRATDSRTGTAAMIWTIQYTDTAKSESEASEMLTFLALQTDYLGDCILFPKWPALDKWRVQAFFEDSEERWLPDGCQRCLTPEKMLSPHTNSLATEPNLG